MKNKLKLSLVDDYIEIMNAYHCVEIEKKCGKQSKRKVEELNSFVSKLKSVYEQLFFKLNMVDESLFQLKNELNDMGKYNEENSAEKFLKHYTLVSEIYKNLTIKLKKLAINEHEAKYLFDDFNLHNVK